MVIVMKKIAKYFITALAATSVLATMSVFTHTAKADNAPSVGVTIGDVPNNYLVVNHAIGGGKGAAVSVELDVTFTQSADALVIGMLPTNNKEDIAQAKINGNGLENSDYVIYWNDGAQFHWSGFKNNTYTQDDSISTVQEHIVGNVDLKLTVGAYGIYDIYMNVPSSNTEMSETVQRDEWITLSSGHAVGVFQEYEVPDRNGVNETGYVFFSMKNVVYNSVTIYPNPQFSFVDEYSDDFSSVETFSSNYVTNDAFDMGVAEGKIVAPQRAMIDTENLNKYYSSYAPIALHPIINTPSFTLEDVTMSVMKDGTALTAGVEGLTFTPTEDGTYDITFSAMDGTVTATHQIVVFNMPQQQNINTKFDADLDAFASEGVTAENGKATMTENAYFGTKGRAKNFVQMVRITSVAEETSDFSVYFGKLMDETTYSVTFQKGTTQVVVADKDGEKTMDIGVDVFHCVSGDGLVIQLKKLGNDVELSLTYGDLPMETLNEPVAKFVVNAPLSGQIGVTSLSGGITLDRYVFINLTGEIEIPDADVEQVPDSSLDDSSDEENSGSNDPASSDKEGGCGGGCGGVLGVGMAACLLPLGYILLSKKKEQ